MKLTKTSLAILLLAVLFLAACTSSDTGVDTTTGTTPTPEGDGTPNWRAVDTPPISGLNGPEYCESKVPLAQIKAACGFSQELSYSGGSLETSSTTSRNKRRACLASDPNYDTLMRFKFISGTNSLDTYAEGDGRVIGYDYFIMDSSEKKVLSGMEYLEGESSTAEKEFGVVVVDSSTAGLWQLSTAQSEEGQWFCPPEKLVEVAQILHGQSGSDWRAIWR